ncbi:hypothetical protein LINPERPRIM_LOCUS545 [Linum perenne]
MVGWFSMGAIDLFLCSWSLEAGLLSTVVSRLVLDAGRWFEEWWCGWVSKVVSFMLESTHKCSRPSSFKMELGGCFDGLKKMMLGFRSFMVWA